MRRPMPRDRRALAARRGGRVGVVAVLGARLRRRHAIVGVGRRRPSTARSALSRGRDAPPPMDGRGRPGRRRSTLAMRRGPSSTTRRWCRRRCRAARPASAGRPSRTPARQVDGGPPAGLLAYVDGEPAGWLGSGRAVARRLERSRTIPRSTTAGLVDRVLQGPVGYRRSASRRAARRRRGLCREPVLPASRPIRSTRRRRVDARSPRRR